MRRLWLLLPGDPATRTGGYLYDARIAAGLEALGWQVSLVPLGEGFPTPTPAEREHARRALAAVPDGEPVLIDGLALGGMAGELQPESARLRLLALIHHPLAEESGLEASLRQRLFLAERAALGHVRRVICTGPATARTLAERYEVPAARIGVVRPGTDPAPLARGSGPTEPSLLCVATLTPRKGHRVLLRALASLIDRPWRLDCAGSLSRSPETSAAVRAEIESLGLGGRVALHGELPFDRLAEYYDRADLFVLASHHEGYGMALAEALARGIPVVSTTAGAIPDTVPAGAGLLVPPGDVGALSAALASVLDDPDLRERLAAGARRARPTLPSWREATERFARELSRASPR